MVNVIWMGKYTRSLGKYYHSMMRGTDRTEAKGRLVILKKNLNLFLASLLIVSLSMGLYLMLSPHVLASTDSMMDPNDLYRDFLTEEIDPDDPLIHRRMNGRIVDSILDEGSDFESFEDSRLRYLVSNDALSLDDRIKGRDIHSLKDDNRETLRRFYNYLNCMDRLTPCENHLIINRGLVPQDLKDDNDWNLRYYHAWFQRASLVIFFSGSCIGVILTLFDIHNRMMLEPY